MRRTALAHFNEQFPFDQVNHPGASSGALKSAWAEMVCEASFAVLDRQSNMIKEVSVGGDVGNVEGINPARPLRPSPPSISFAS